jgi:hypothetical protein
VRTPLFVFWMMEKNGVFVSRSAGVGGAGTGLAAEGVRGAVALVVIGRYRRGGRVLAVAQQRFLRTPLEKDDELGRLPFLLHGLGSSKSASLGVF